MNFIGHVHDGRIVLDGPIMLPNGTLVRVEPVPSGGEPTTLEAMRLMEQSGSLDFWKDEAEDLYSTSDGEPV